MKDKSGRHIGAPIMAEFIKLDDGHYQVHILENGKIISGADIYGSKFISKESAIKYINDWLILNNYDYTDSRLGYVSGVLFDGEFISYLDII